MIRLIWQRFVMTLICDLVAASVIISVCSVPSSADQGPGFWVAGPPMYQARHVEGDPTLFKADEWEYFLYKPGQSPSSNGFSNSWGTISAKTAAEATSQLASDQDFERRWDRWLNQTTPSSQYTYTNPFGPVAVVYDTKDDSTTIARVAKRAAFLGKLADAYVQIQSVADKISDMKLPGSQMTSYVKRILDIQKQVTSMQSRLNRATQPSMIDLMSSLDQIDKDLTAIGKELAMLPSSQSPQPEAQSTATDKWTNVSGFTCLQLYQHNGVAEMYRNSCNVDMIFSYGPGRGEWCFAPGGSNDLRVFPWFPKTETVNTDPNSECYH